MKRTKYVVNDRAIDNTCSKTSNNLQVFNSHSITKLCYLPPFSVKIPLKQIVIMGWFAVNAGERL